MSEHSEEPHCLSDSHSEGTAAAGGEQDPPGRGRPGLSPGRAGSWGEFRSQSVISPNAPEEGREQAFQRENRTRLEDVGTVGTVSLRLVARGRPALSSPLWAMPWGHCGHRLSAGKEGGARYPPLAAAAGNHGLWAAQGHPPPAGNTPQCLGSTSPKESDSSLILGTPVCRTCRGQGAGSKARRGGLQDGGPGPPTSSARLGVQQTRPPVPADTPSGPDSNEQCQKE